MYLSLVEAAMNAADDGDVLVRSKPSSVLFMERPMLPKNCNKGMLGEHKCWKNK